MGTNREIKDVPEVDYTPFGMLRQSVEQVIAMIDMTICMDEKPMDPVIEARFAALRRMLMGGLVAAAAPDHDDDETGSVVPSAYCDRHRWTFMVVSVGNDVVQVASSDARGLEQEARLPLSMLQDVKPEPGMEIVVRLVDDGSFHVSRVDDAVPPRNEINPILHRRDVAMLQRLVEGLRRPRQLASKIPGTMHAG